RRRMRANGGDALQRRPGRRREAVVYSQRRFADDRQRSVVQQVVRFRDRPCERALDGQDAEVDFRCYCRVDDSDEARQRDRAIRVGREDGRGSVAMTAGGPGVADDAQRRLPTGASAASTASPNRAVVALPLTSGVSDEATVEDLNPVPTVPFFRQ